MRVEFFVNNIRTCHMSISHLSNTELTAAEKKINQMCVFGNTILETEVIENEVSHSRLKSRDACSFSHAIGIIVDVVCVFI